MKNRYLAPAFALTLTLGACTSEGDNAPASSSTDPRIHNTVQVKNILGVPIQLSDNPNTLSQKTHTGDFPAGALATAVCIENVPEYPGSSSVYVYYSGTDARTEGYASINSASTKDSVGPQQLDPGYQVLVNALPACRPGFEG